MLSLSKAIRAAKKPTVQDGPISVEPLPLPATPHAQQETERNLLANHGVVTESTPIRLSEEG